MKNPNIRNIESYIITRQVVREDDNNLVTNK